MELTKIEWLEAKTLIEDIEFALSRLHTNKPVLTLGEIHQKTLRLHRILKGQ